MTRKEAIANLNMISVAFVDPVTKEQRKLIDDTFDIAIKALEQEPCRYWQNGKCNGNTEVCEDAISRQAVTDTTICDGISCNECPFNTCEDGQAGWLLKECLLKERVDKLPSVTPQPKTGHWILSDDGLYRPICDKCGAHPWKGYIPTVEEATEVFKYCPNCGAKMIEPQERSDKG